MASSSRDSTVRMWSLNSLVQPIELNVLAGKPWTSVLGSTGTRKYWVLRDNKQVDMNLLYSVQYLQEHYFFPEVAMK